LILKQEQLIQMSKVGEWRWLVTGSRWRLSTTVIRILWTPVAWSSWPPSSCFQQYRNTGLQRRARSTNRWVWTNSHFKCYLFKFSSWSDPPWTLSSSYAEHSISV